MAEGPDGHLVRIGPLLTRLVAIPSLPFRRTTSRSEHLAGQRPFHGVARRDAVHHQSPKLDFGECPPGTVVVFAQRRQQPQPGDDGGPAAGLKRLVGQQQVDHLPCSRAHVRPWCGIRSASCPRHRRWPGGAVPAAGTLRPGARRPGFRRPIAPFERFHADYPAMGAAPVLPPVGTPEGTCAAARPARANR